MVLKTDLFVFDMLNSHSLFKGFKEKLCGRTQFKILFVQFPLLHVHFMRLSFQSALASSSRFGHYYDVSKTMDPEIRQAAKCHCFYLPEHSTHSSTTHR